MAGLISDYTNGRATTCCIMLILAAPMVCITSRVKHMCSRGLVRAVEMCAHLGIYAHACLFACVSILVHTQGRGRSQGEHRKEIWTENFGKGLATTWPWWRKGRPAAKVLGQGEYRKLRLGKREIFVEKKGNSILPCVGPSIRGTFKDQEVWVRERKGVR